MANSALDTYLNDHLAGATAGTNLAKMAAEEHRSDEHGAFFGELASEISADYETLQRLVEALAVDESASKTALAEIGSKMMAPKFTGGDDELNAFVTLETLSIGVEGKICMWKALKTIESDYPALRGVRHRRAAQARNLPAQRIEDQRLKMAPLALQHTVNA